MTCSIYMPRALLFTITVIFSSAARVWLDLVPFLFYISLQLDCDGTCMALPGSRICSGCEHHKPFSNMAVARRLNLFQSS